MAIPRLLNRAGPASVALETTLILHGVPRANATQVAADLAAEVRAAGANPAYVGLVAGTPIVGLSDAELRTLLDAPAQQVPKVNAANLGLALARAGSPGTATSFGHGATTVSTTLELAHAAGVRVFATGGLGGVHTNLAQHLDISGDLAALARYPLVVVTAGVKSILDVVGTREVLEALGVCVVGYQTDRFPAFYLRESAAGVDARFDDLAALAGFAHAELSRTGRALVVANPIPEADALDPREFSDYLDRAQRDALAQGISGRAITPFLLARLHDLSNGATLRANIALARHNARVAGQIAAHFARVPPLA
jgi:pseudouridine-5'-phosphate glycosidase